MSSYLDIETVEASAIAMRGLVDIEKRISNVRSVDMNEDAREPIQDVMTSGLVLMACGEPYGLIRMEDVWVQMDVWTVAEQKVAAKALDMLYSPHKYVEDED